MRVVLLASVFAVHHRVLFVGSDFFHGTSRVGPAYRNVSPTVASCGGGGVAVRAVHLLPAAGVCCRHHHRRRVVCDAP